MEEMYSDNNRLAENEIEELKIKLLNELDNLLH